MNGFDTDGFYDVDDTKDQIDPIDPADVVRAERLLGQLRRLQAERYEIAEIVDYRIAEALAYQDDRCHGIDQREQWIVTQLEAWHRARVAAGMVSGKSWVGVSGTVKLRKPGAPKLVVEDGTDPETFRGPRPDWTRPKVEFDKAQIKADTVPGPDGVVVDKATGEVVDGLRYVVADSDTFSWEVTQ